MRILHQGIQAGLRFSTAGDRLIIRGPQAARQLGMDIMAKKDEVLPIILLVEEIQDEVRVMSIGEEPGFARWPQEHKVQWARSLIQIIEVSQLEPLVGSGDMKWLQQVSTGLSS